MSSKFGIITGQNGFSRGEEAEVRVCEVRQSREKARAVTSTASREIEVKTRSFTMCVQMAQCQVFCQRVKH